jgi:galactose mutarotase-like enzyme
MYQVVREGRLELRDESARSSVLLVPERGAIATRFRVDERDVLYLDEATLRDPAKNVRGGIPLLFPSPGRLAGDRFERDGASGAMKQHGFARDLAWTVVDTSDRTSAQAVLALVANDATRAVFPWDFRLAVTFSLSGTRLRLDAIVENASTRPMPFAFGIHPYFRVTDKAGASVSTKATRAFDNVTKEETSLGPGGLDLTAHELDLHLLDHGSTDSTLSLSDESRVAIRASREFVRWVVWTVEGKDYVCVEPWTAPANALNSGESLLSVEPGGSQRLWIEIQYVRPPTLSTRP